MVVVEVEGQRRKLLRWRMKFYAAQEIPYHAEYAPDVVPLVDNAEAM